MTRIWCVTVVVAACAVGVACGGEDEEGTASARGQASARSVFLEDPGGRVDGLAASGRHVAWTVRTPADPVRPEARRRPVTVPRATRIVVADERGGQRLAFAAREPLVRELRMVRGPQGEPQLAVRSCGSRAQASCRADLYTLSAEPPVRIIRRTSGADAEAAADGVLDRGRRLDASGRGCDAGLTVRSLARPAAPAQALPPLPQARDELYPRCDRVTERLLRGDHAFAWVRRTNPDADLEAEIVYGIDLTAGARARWREVQRPYRASAGSAGIAIGPAVTDHALFWEALDEEGRAGSLEQVALPRDVRADRTAQTPTTADPVAPHNANGCALAATDTAIYALANPRCATVPSDSGDDSDDDGAVIRRLTGPVFRPAPPG